MKNTIIIEFVGLAAVGKTTICNSIYKKMETKNFNCNLINKTNLPFLKKINLKFLFLSIHVALRIKQNNVLYFIKSIKFAYSSMVKTNYFRLIQGINICDQGIFQCIGTMRKNSNTYRHIWDEKLIKKIPIPNLLIIINADTQILANRRQNRDGCFNYEDIIIGQKRLIKTLEEAKAISKYTPDFNYLYIENNEIDSNEVIVDRIIETIEDIYKRSANMNTNN